MFSELKYGKKLLKYVMGAIGNQKMILQWRELTMVVMALKHLDLKMQMGSVEIQRLKKMQGIWMMKKSIKVKWEIVEKRASRVE
jgi:hypothetical protein